MQNDKRDRLVEIIGDKPFTTEYERYDSFEWAEHFADHLIENDVVPVVRCGKCIWYNEEKFICTNPHCTKSFYGCRVGENHFCSYGERKDDYANG